MAIAQITQPLTQNCVVALGLFDGVHIGHRAVLTAAVSAAGRLGIQPCAFTFVSAALPQKQGRALQYLYTESQKDALLSACGITGVYRPDFAAVQTMDGERFCREILMQQLHAAAVFCGRDFRFGARAGWDFTDLCRFGQQLGFTVTPVEPVLLDDEIVSSTSIRRLLLSGDPQRSATLLGKPYHITGPVLHGNAIGRTIQFPTINQAFTPGQLVPRYGVYASRVVTADGTCVPGVTNIGTKPTIGGTVQPLAETHLLGFTGDLYGTTCETQLLHFLRPEQKFASLQELTAAITADCDHARTLLDA